MKVLLDTNVLLFWLGNTPRITPGLSEIMRSDRNLIFYSSLNVWECRIKAARGALRVDDDFLNVLLGKRMRELSFTAAHAEETKNLPAIHNDPFDRGLIAQARVEGMSLVTSDHLLARYDVHVLLV